MICTERPPTGAVPLPVAWERAAQGIAGALAAAGPAAFDWLSTQGT